MQRPDRPAVARSELWLRPDPRRVLARAYLPDEDPAAPEGRVVRLLRQLAALPDGEVDVLLAEVRTRFADRHRDLDGALERSFAEVRPLLDAHVRPSAQLRALMGAYFTHEFAIEGAALFNPSMVPAPDQRGVPAGAQRFVMSLRAVGEGHLSSIEFRTGTVTTGGQLSLDPFTPFVQTGARRSPLYEKARFLAKLGELGVGNPVAAIATRCAG